MLWFCAPLAAGEPVIRVGLQTNVTTARIRLSGGGVCAVSDGTRADLVTVSSVGALSIVLVSSAQVRIGNRVYTMPCSLESRSPGRLLLHGRRYDGVVQVRKARGSGLNIINILPLEHYLCGVVPYEIAPEWCDEMLKVQAVAARTWTVANRGRHRSQGFDVCTGAHCQVYQGVSQSQDARVRRSVLATRGYVVADNARNPILAYYHAACGGHTEDAREMWSFPTHHGYLAGRPCPHCRESPYGAWTCVVSTGRFAQVLQSAGVRVGRVREVRVGRATSAGRAHTLRVVGSAGRADVSVRKLRRIMGVNRLKSARIANISIFRSTVAFSGSGWGHGVGLCQWGADRMARSGEPYDAVLRYYYSGTRLVRLYD